MTVQVARQEGNERGGTALLPPGTPDVQIGTRAYFTKPALARALDVSQRTISRWTALRTGPPSTRIGQRLLFSADGVEDWLRKRETRLVRD